MNIILSKDNNKIKDLIRIRDNLKFQHDKSLFYVEGERIVKDIPIELIHSLYIDELKAKEFQYITSKINLQDTYILKHEIFNKIKSTVNSQGIIALVNYNILTSIDIELLKDINSIIILDHIQDPGNLGTIIRLSEATNIDLIVLGNNCCNLYNQKVIRASMSSLFRKKILISDDLSSLIKLLKSASFNIFATILDKSAKRMNNVKFAEKNAIIFGNEANGISNEIVNISDERIYIPMFGKIESLNVAVSATVICYELMRQKNYYEI